MSIHPSGIPITIIPILKTFRRKQKLQEARVSSLTPMLGVSASPVDWLH